VPRAKVGWSAEHRWVVLSFNSTGNVEQAADLIGNAVVASAQVPADRDLSVFVVEKEPADVRSKGDLAARPKSYHFGAVVFPDAEAEMLLAEHETYEIGRRDVPLQTLLRERDPRFRPVDELGAARKLDRPIVPLLNALVACGCRPHSSCAGHLNLTKGTRALSEGDPYVMLDATSRALAVARNIAQHFDAWRVQVSARHGGGGLVLRLDEEVASRERQRPRTLEERRALDARLVEAAIAVDPALFSRFHIDEPSEEQLLLTRVGFRSDVDWIRSLQPGMVRNYVSRDPTADDQGVRVAPMAVMNEIGPTGEFELRLMNYEVGDRWLDALISAPSFAELSTAVNTAIG